MTLPKVMVDFEYNRTRDRYMNLVACCAKVEDGPVLSWWLDGDEKERERLRCALLEMRDTHVFVAFNVVAEASAFIALRLDPTKFKWVDLQLEYKMLLNHSHKFMYGDQLIKGKIRKTKPPKPKWQQTDRERLESDSSKAERSLAACTFKLLGRQIDLAEKDRMRDLILSEPEVWREEDKADVLRYCASDVEVLPEIDAKIDAYYASHPMRHRNLHDIKYRLWRGETAARAALIERIGYPVNPEKVRNFAKAVPTILNDLAKDIGEQFPGLFEWNKARGAYTLKQKPQQEFIAASPHALKWQKTDGGGPSLALDAWTRHYSWSHDYPRDILPAQILRYLKTKQSLNGFMPRPKKVTVGERKSFFDYFGDDGRARCWLNPYGSQSSRFQPSATGFIPLKSAWMRSMIEPRPGFSIASIDYASEEFLLSALLSKDEAMFQAYASGDPYLSFAKLSKAVPETATKDSHPLERQRAKSTVLGISYLMGPISLCDKLSLDTGVHHTPEQAEKQIDLFFSVFARYAAWIDKTIDDYKTKNYLTLLDGWVMFGDNDNRRSVSNCPVQGAGGCVLRRAIKLAQERGLRVIIPLHDALYIEYPSDQPEKIDQLAEAMLEGFSHYFRNDERIFQWSKAIRLDLDAWGPDLVDGKFTTPAGREVKSQSIYVDPRAKSEYERFSRYFQ